MTIDYNLSRGSHASREAGMCAMEWVAYIAGEEHSDSPKCVDPVLQRFSMTLNDRLPDDLRQRLRPYLARMIGTANDGIKRRWAMADWAIRVAAAAAQDAVGRRDLGDRLRAVEEVVDAQGAERVVPEVRAVRDVAAAYAADAAADADAAAYAAAYAADAAADAAAYAADVAAAYAAAAAAADVAAADARRQMWEHLLPSALDLLDRLLPTETVELPEPMQAEYAQLLRA